MTHVAIVERPLDLSALVAEVSQPGAGAISTFVGVVRNTNEGRSVTGIDYSAYRPMAARELESIVTVAAGNFDGLRVAVEHRVGTLAVGEASVMIAASHARRAEALAAVQFVIEELKRRVPIWKREHYADGTREWVHASAMAVPGAGAQRSGA